MLENEISAKRGTTPLAVLSGYGTSSDASDIVRPDPQGAARSMQLALADADLNPSDIDYINAHGTGTILNDVSESNGPVVTEIEYSWACAWGGGCD
jgi:nodulation protein E